ncbi:lymphatic vessel endothelial hyaluronic receptor 1b isoform X1 [Anguilla rostrata]|uniref:lymphatic vessel endothelial hyaluronic receptor 1b isoform X1 n=2 Tax=Anguilla rostrata TaxID=7938 RepID=UPI0030CBA2D2
MVWIFLLLCHLSLAISTLAINPSQIKVFPETGRGSGVFLASLQPVQNRSPPYAFNASQAREVCLMLNAIIASRAQVEEAHRNGLETCRFGWVDEQIAVIPRITPSKLCGQNQVGVIVWRSVPTRSFDAFCFNSSDIKTEVPVSTTKIPTTAKPTSSASSSPTPAPTYPPSSPLPQTTQSAPSSPLPQTTQSAPSSPLPQTTQSAPSSSLPQTTQSALSSPPTLTFSSTLSPPLSTPSSPTPASSTYLSSSTSYLLPLSTSPVSPVSVPPSPANTEPLRPEPKDISSSGSPLGDTVTSHHSGVTVVVPTVLIAILFLLATVMALWYYKIRNKSRMLPFWRRGRQKDEFETEVWENLCHEEVKEPHTQMELGGFRNDCKESSPEEDSQTHFDSP